MRIKTRIYFAIFFVAALNGLLLWGEDAEPLLTITASQQTIQVGAEFKIKIVLNNTTSQDVPAMVASVSRALDCSIEITDVHGTRVRGKYDAPTQVTERNGRKYKTESSGGSKMAVSLPPGQSLERELSLSDKYDLQPGIYQIRAKWIDKDNVIVRSNVLTLAVTP